MPFTTFDRSKLKLKPLRERKHDLDISSFLDLTSAFEEFEHPYLRAVAERMVLAREQGGVIIWMLGAHVIRAGVSKFIIDLMERGFVSHIACNGACAIHDYEISLIGATTESVSRYISEGQFGLWEETGAVNEAAKAAHQEGIGFGEALGRMIWEGNLPHRQFSIFGNAYRLGIPITVHVGIGYDIVHEHPNCDGAAIGAASYHDFLIFAESVSKLEGGILLSFGSAVMAPEVFLKALAMARNVAHQRGERICHFTVAVFDIQRLSGDLKHEPQKSSPEYYFRPWKTMLVRTVADGGESFYICGEHRLTIPNLHRLIGTISGRSYNKANGE
ncbi:MAG: hypothetical protein RMK18_11590 [Armatimonadota bacterium]|nr:hypothetical protein [Armatimonadota bacterium]MCX7777916.1 hypothetical protein [Armatimonadota bacterium]MDW8026488.1 hypothetical protein [Armatimonadota bacterium]